MWNGTMFVDLDWPLNASSLLSASAELLVETFADCHEVRFHSYLCINFLFMPVQEINLAVRLWAYVQCSDAVGWATGRASGVSKKTECWYAVAGDLTGALHHFLYLLLQYNPERFNFLVLACRGFPWMLASNGVCVSSWTVLNSQQH